MSGLIPPHGGELRPLKPEGAALDEAITRVQGLPKVAITTRERDDLIMLGIFFKLFLT